MKASNILILLALALAVGCAASDDPSEEAATGEPAAIHAVPAEKMTLHPSVDLVGTLVPIPEHTCVLSTQVEGQVERVCVEEGTEVHAGDELVVLDARAAQANRAKANAVLAEVRSALELLRQGAHPRAIEAARQDVVKAEAAERALRGKVDALKPLHEKKEVSDVRYEQANAEWAAAQAESGAAASRLKLLEAGARPEELAEAEAKVASAEADVASQELAVALCTIKSPIDGVVTELPTRQGMYVTPATTLATIMDIRTLFAQVRVPAVHLSEVRVGAEVNVVVTSLSDLKQTGAIARLGKEADALTGDVTAFASVANSNGVLRPGLACRVRVALPDVPDAVVVPIAAVSDRDGVPVVTVIREAKAYETEVQLGVQTPEFAQVLQGVAQGDLVAVQGGYGLPDGCPVRLIEDSGRGETQEMPSPAQESH